MSEVRCPFCGHEFAPGVDIDRYDEHVRWHAPKYGEIRDAVEGEEFDDLPRSVLNILGRVMVDPDKSAWELIPPRFRDEHPDTTGDE